MLDERNSKTLLPNIFSCQNGTAPNELKQATCDDTRVYHMQVLQGNSKQSTTCVDALAGDSTTRVPVQKASVMSVAELEAPPGVRTSQAYLVGASRFLCYLTRGQLGVLLPILALELEISPAERGRLMSQYSLGYITTQIAGGVAADLVGGYAVMTTAFLMSAAACFAAPQLAQASRLGGALLLLGLAQGTVMPAGSVVSAKWLLPSERAWGSAISAIGSALGTFAVNACAPPLASQFGWPAVFHACGLLCVAFVLVSLCLGISSPSSSCIGVEESDALKACGMLSTEVKGGQVVLPPSYFFAKASVWALFVAHFSQNWQASFAEWMPTLYSSRLEVRPDVAGLHLAAIALVELPARFLTKDLPKLLLQRGWSLTLCRKCMSIQGFTLHTVSLLCLAAMMMLRSQMNVSPIFFTIVFCVGKVSQSMHAGGYFANYFDLTRKYAGALTGIGNTLATLAGLIFPLLASGQVDAELGWIHLIGVVAAMNAVAIAAISQGLSTDCLDG